MIKTLIDRLVGTYPTEIEAAADMIALAAPFLLLALAIWLLAHTGEWLIDWTERRRISKARSLRYRTVSARQLDRDMRQLWGRAHGPPPPPLEPWRDTMPPGQPARQKVRAGSVVAFPRTNQVRRP